MRSHDKKVVKDAHQYIRRNAWASAIQLLDDHGAWMPSDIQDATTAAEEALVKLQRLLEQYCEVLND